MQGCFCVFTCRGFFFTNVILVGEKCWICVCLFFVCLFDLLFNYIPVVSWIIVFLAVGRSSGWGYSYFKAVLGPMASVEAGLC